MPGSPDQGLDFGPSQRGILPMALHARSQAPQVGGRKPRAARRRTRSPPWWANPGHSCLTSPGGKAQLSNVTERRDAVEKGTREHQDAAFAR